MDKVKKEDIILKYKEISNVWKVGEFFGISGQYVHEILTNSGDINKMNYWTDKDSEFLKIHYLNYRNNLDLSTLAEIMNRTKPFISRKAKLLGLTDNKNAVSMKKFAKQTGERISKYIKENGHPKGMKDKFHTEKTKQSISESSKKTWSNKDHYLNSDEYKQIQSDRMMIDQSKGILGNGYSRTKSGTVIIGGKKYFYRSEWEVNIAAYFEFLKTNKKIKEWEYEVDTFWFEKIKRGVRSYKPDFKITNNDDSQYYVEVKGWMDDKSKTKLKRMKIYHPEIKLELLEKDRYKDISRMKKIISEKLRSLKLFPIRISPEIILTRKNWMIWPLPSRSTA